MILKPIVEKYFPGKKIKSIDTFGNGHIHDTYRLILEEVEENYILQRINTRVFNDPRSIADVHFRLQETIINKGDPYTIASIIPYSSGSYIFVDDKGAAWKMTSFITDTHTIDGVEEDWQALEAGKAFGWFARACSQLNVGEFREAIRDFHSLSFRLDQLKMAIENDTANRFKGVLDIVDLYARREFQLLAIEKLIEAGKIPKRIVHNDTKINNLLFRGKKAVAVIDLDTVGPGTIYFDYGDALRTSANLALEDETDLSRVGFNISAFRAFTGGYLTQMRPIMTTTELEYLYLAPRYMTFIMGIRFLTDFLNGDKYYKTSYPEHNLIRSKVQMKLIESMEGHETEMKAIIEAKK